MVRQEYVMGYRIGIWEQQQQQLGEKERKGEKNLINNASNRSRKAISPDIGMDY